MNNSLTAAIDIQTIAPKHLTFYPNVAVRSAISTVTVDQPLEGAGHTVRVCATTPVVLTGVHPVDGVSLNAGDRVLVTAQEDPRQNGIYAAATGAWLRLPLDQVGTVWVVAEGFSNGDTVWLMASPNGAVVYNVDPILYVGFVNVETLRTIVNAAVRRANGAANTSSFKAASALVEAADCRRITKQNAARYEIAGLPLSDACWNANAWNIVPYHRCVVVGGDYVPYQYLYALNPKPFRFKAAVPGLYLVSASLGLQLNTAVQMAAPTYMWLSVFRNNTQYAVLHTYADTPQAWTFWLNGTDMLILAAGDEVDIRFKFSSPLMGIYAFNTEECYGYVDLVRIGDCPVAGPAAPNPGVWADDI